MIIFFHVPKILTSETNSEQSETCQAWCRVSGSNGDAFMGERTPSEKGVVIHIGVQFVHLMTSEDYFLCIKMFINDV